MPTAASAPDRWNPQVGDKLPQLERGPITRGTLALFAGASNDHALLHIDTDYVRSAGMDDVFAHGMLVMAYVGHLLTSVAPQQDIRDWSVRFVAVTPVHATIRCRGEVTEIATQDGEKRARLRVEARTAEGVLVLEGDASIALQP